MYSIDFLPDDYHRQASDRRLHVWLAILLTVFGGFVGIVGLQQHLMWQNLERQFQVIQIPFSQAELANQRVAELREQLAEANDLAELYTYLRHPWPRTRILATLIEALPPEISLSEVTIERVELDGAGKDQRRRTPTRASPDAETETKPLTVRRMLDELRHELDATSTVVHARGVTTDNSALHRCIAALNDSWLFTKVQLESLDSMEDEHAPRSATFEISLEVLPGYGQPGGPERASTDRIASVP